MNTLLTNAIIEEAFAKTGVDRKYFPQYEAEAKRRYELNQEDFPEDEDPTYEDNNANKSIILANDYIAYYVQEAEKGHSHKWSDSVARARVSGEHEFNVYYDAYSSIENEAERERELRIRAKSLFPDSFAQDRYIFLFKNQAEYPQKDTEEYVKAYHNCISKGKSETYAHAYADAVNNGFQGYNGIYAEAYEQAKNQGMNDDQAVSFGVFCKCAAENGFYSDIEIENFKKIYQERWQREYYLHLICCEHEKQHKTQIDENEVEYLKKLLRI